MNGGSSSSRGGQQTAKAAAKKRSKSLKLVFPFYISWFSHISWIQGTRFATVSLCHSFCSDDHSYPIASRESRAAAAAAVDSRTCIECTKGQTDFGLFFLQSRQTRERERERELREEGKPSPFIVITGSPLFSLSLSPSLCLAVCVRA